MDTAERTDIAERLFAEDVVSHFMNKLFYHDTPFRNISVAPIAGRFRSSVYNGFTENVRKTVDIMYHSMDNYIRRILRGVERDIRENAFRVCYVESGNLWQGRYPSADAGVLRFLKYCVYMGALTNHFFRYGYRRTPDKTAGYITQILHKVGMTDEWWEKLNSFAESVARDHVDRPGSSSSIPQQEHSDSDSRPDSNFEDCRCFRTEITGDSFRKIYLQRERVMKLHEQCLKKGSSNQISPKSTTSESGTFEQSVSRADSSSRDMKNSETTKDIEDTGVEDATGISPDCMSNTEHPPVLAQETPLEKLFENVGIYPEASSSTLLYEGEFSEEAIQQLQSFATSHDGNEQSGNPQPKLSADSPTLSTPNDEEILNPQDDSGELSGNIVKSTGEL